MGYVRTQLAVEGSSFCSAARLLINSWCHTALGCTMFFGLSGSRRLALLQWDLGQQLQDLPQLPSFPLLLCARFLPLHPRPLPGLWVSGPCVAGTCSPVFPFPITLPRPSPPEAALPAEPRSCLTLLPRAARIGRV